MAAVGPAAPANLSLIEKDGQLTQITGGGNKVGRLIFRHVNSGSFTNARMSVAPSNDHMDENYMLGMTVVCYMRERRWPAARNVLIGETMAPSADGSEFMGEAESRAELARGVTGYLNENGLGAFEAASTAIQLYTKPAANNVNREAKTQAVIDGDTQIKYKRVIPPSMLAKLTANGSLKTEVAFNHTECSWIACVIGFNPSRPLRRCLRLALCEFVIAVSKSGNATAGWLNRTSASLTTSFGDEIALERERIRLVYSLFSDKVTEPNIAHMANIWTPLVAQNCIKLVTILNQCSGHGVTGLQLIGEAMSSYPDFCWDVIAEMIPGDFTGANAARTAFANRPYVGYNNEMMQAHGIQHYKTLAWVARLLLIEAGGENSLANYRGLVDNVVQGTVYRTLVAAYIAGQGVGGAPPATAASAQLAGQHTPGHWKNIFAP